MELLAFSLAVLSGVGHAVWNFLTKRAILSPIRSLNTRPSQLALLAAVFFRWGLH